MPETDINLPLPFFTSYSNAVMNISSLAIIAVLSFAAKASGDLGITPQPPDTADERLVDCKSLCFTFLLSLY